MIINLEILGEENKDKYTYIYFLNIKKFLQFGQTTWRNHSI